MNPVCQYVGCTKTASYASRFGCPERCKEHREYRRPQHRICRCGSATPSFGDCQDDRPSCCKKCRSPGMENIHDRPCESTDCKRQPCFNHPDQKRGRFCLLHREEGMVDVKNRRCEHPDCRLQPSFNFPLEKRRRFCQAHRLEGMIHVHQKNCEMEHCRVRPSFNVATEKTPRFCVRHKQDGMVNVIDRFCEAENCLVQHPVFDLPDQKKGRFCRSHRTDDMVDVVHKKCEHPQCRLRPMFNLPNENQARFCAKHRSEGMVNVLETCRHEDCSIFPVFNLPGKKRGAYCIRHKTDGMIDVKNIHCFEKGCRRQPSYNFENEIRAIYCARHKKDGMLDLSHKPCKNREAMCTVRANPKYRDYCAWCFQHLFPDDPLTARIRTKSKEITVREYINDHFEGFVHDKPLLSPHCDCTLRRRIDHYRLIGNTMLAIETDEHQHRGYDPQRETLRYHDVYMGFSGKWIFIRFNPDSFRDADGTIQDPPLIERLIALKTMIQEQMERIANNENQDMMEIHRMYYDEMH